MYCQLSDRMWMHYAIRFADFAEYYNEVSVGAVLVLNGYIIGWGWNSSIALHDPTAHAEIIALRQGGRIISNYRLLNTTLYVTLEPCIMCFGAMIHARVFRLVFGAQDKKNGIFSLKDHYFRNFNFNHHIIYTGGILKELCAQKIVDFFHRKRLRMVFKHKCVSKIVY